jgi:hypothetical protein
MFKLKSENPHLRPLFEPKKKNERTKPIREGLWNSNGRGKDS